MDYQFALLSWILFLTAGIGLFVALVAWRRRDTPTAQYLILMEAGVVVWAFTAAIEAAASTIPLKLLWSQISYLGITSTIASYFFLAIAYGQHSKYLTPRYISLILIIPLLTIFAVATNNWHHSFYTDIFIKPENNIAIYEHGILFWIYTFYAYSLLVIGLVIIIRAILRFPAIYKSQSLILIIGALFPFTGNVMYVFNLNPIPGVDWTPIAFGLSGLILTWGIFRYRLLDLIPIARHKLVETMNDGVLVIDAQGRIADYNPAMQAITGIPTKQTLGQVATQALAHWEELIDCL
ncbi:MAG: PAS domain-containing protein, partial [Candidatus Marinimicrobia bacterium]|nr:PAS domain-containing protein [Candidatus Neomarinimicrobiota bacterium]